MAIIATTALLIGPAFGQAAAQQCGPMLALTAWLADKYHESARGMGVAANGTLMQLFASPGGTWTITVTTEAGVMCMVASGTDYAEPPAGDPA